MKHHPLSIKPLFYLIFSCLLVLGSQTTLAADKDTDQTNQTLTSTDGHFVVTIDSWLKPLKLGRMHAWTAAINNADGQPVTDAEIKVGGGMPIHNHGFPTQPEVTKQVEDGVYLIEGIKFSMGGPWVLLLDITSGETVDSVAFDIDM